MILLLITGIGSILLGFLCMAVLLIGAYVTFTDPDKFGTRLPAILLILAVVVWVVGDLIGAGFISAFIASLG